VWQDFLFACGNYPASDDFVENVKREAEQQIKRVGHHAALVLWAGNNEDYMLAERWGWEYDPEDQEGYVSLLFQLFFRSLLEGRLG
jgi:beta-mannosidase